MRGLVLILMLALSVGFAGSAAAVEPDEVLADSALESRARALSAELRCMVCQNQSIDDSNAPLARDLRILVRERIAAGDSDGEVVDFRVARYGEFILLKPRFSGGMRRIRDSTEAMVSLTMKLENMKSKRLSAVTLSILAIRCW
jgi:cytochrome c-type biogenesis protein CcmH